MDERFRGKKFTVMGLDANGRGFQDAKYLVKKGAEVIGTDLRNADQLPEAVALAREFSNLRLVLGQHRLEDFSDRDFVIRAALAPLDSPYLAEARKNNIPVVSDETLFLMNAPKLTTIGITGTRGKTTVTYMIYEILKASGRRVFLGGNVQGVSLLPLLDEVQNGDIVVMELDSWKLQSFAEVGISPHVAVFTTFFPDHLNYYKGDVVSYFADKTAIYKNQKAEDVLISSRQVAVQIETHGGYNSRLVVADKISADWQLKILGEHNRENAGLALEAVRQLAISDEISRHVLEEFEGVSGRLQYLGSKNGVDFYNDTTATSPEGVMAALSSLNKPSKIVLLAGGADKSLDYKQLVREFDKNLKALVLFKGAASDKILTELREINFKFLIRDSIGSMQEAVDIARKFAEAGDIILLSPGAASFGVFKNEYDRGDQFIELFKQI